jgi:hypothetical protein
MSSRAITLEDVRELGAEIAEAERELASLRGRRVGLAQRAIDQEYPPARVAEALGLTRNGLRFILDPASVPGPGKRRKAAGGTSPVAGPQGGDPRKG